MDALLQDLKYAVRGFLKAPGFTAVALLTLALGTGANATVFSFVNALLLRPAPVVADPSRVVAVYTSDFSSGPYGDSSYLDYLSVREEATAFASLAAYREGAPVLLKHGDSIERLREMNVSPELFSVLGLRAAQGRLLGDADAVPGTAVAVISHGLWHRMFGADPSVVGRDVTLNGRRVSIVGIAPEGFEGLNLGAAFDVFTPLDTRLLTDRGSRLLSVVGRLRPDAELSQAQAQVAAIAERLGSAYPESNRGTLANPDRARPMVALRHTRLHPSFREGQAGLISVILLGAVLVVLLIACANVANLLLARASARSREMAIRLALGAGRRRLITQMITESALLGMAGGALGLLFALWTADVLPSFFPAEQARLLDASIDGRVFLYTAVISLAASLLFGCAPAFQALRPSAASVLRGDAGRVSDPRGGARVRSILVVAQVALAMVLLVSAGLLVRSVANALAADLGFATRDAVVATLELPPDRPAERGLQFFEDAVSRVRALPGVTSASLVRTLPLTRGARRTFTVEGYQPQPGEDMELPFNIVEHAYFETMRMPILAGRAFTEADRAQGADVAIVNEVLARRYFGGNAVGRRLLDARNNATVIVGVVPAGKYLTVQGPEVPIVYYPLAQNYTARMTLVASTGADAVGTADEVRRTLASIDRDAAVFRVMTLNAHLAETLGGDRLTAALVASCGGLALLLALVGIYGVVSFAVGRRTREIGVRVALGARPLQIAGLVVGEGLRVLSAGLLIGLAAAAAAARLLESMLYGVGSSDAATFIAVAVALGVVALIAATLPARRALAVNPIAVLRQD